MYEHIYIYISVGSFIFFQVDTKDSLPYLFIYSRPLAHVFPINASLTTNDLTTPWMDDSTSTEVFANTDIILCAGLNLTNQGYLPLSGLRSPLIIINSHYYLITFISSFLISWMSTPAHILCFYSTVFYIPTIIDYAFCHGWARVDLPHS